MQILFKFWRTLRMRNITFSQFQCECVRLKSFVNIRIPRISYVWNLLELVSNNCSFNGHVTPSDKAPPPLKLVENICEKPIK